MMRQWSRSGVFLATLLLVAVAVILAYAAGLAFPEDKTVQRWSLVIGSTASVIGAVVMIYQFYVWVIRRKAAKSEQIREALDELRALADRRELLWGGRSTQPGDYFNVHWSFARRLGRWQSRLLSSQDMEAFTTWLSYWDSPSGR